MISYSDKQVFIHTFKKEKDKAEQIEK